jgi:hypothetical protein
MQDKPEPQEPAQRWYSQSIWGNDRCVSALIGLAIVVIFGFAIVVIASVYL